MENYSKMKNYFRIEREASEKMRDFVVRYEKAESECRKAIGKSMFEGEAKGFHVLEQANLTESQKADGTSSLWTRKVGVQYSITNNEEDI